MGKAKKRPGPNLVRVGDLKPGDRIRFHDGVTVTNPTVYEVVRFLPIKGTDQGHLDLADPETGRLESAPQLLNCGFRVELVT
ncbi:MAG: hypothetical protein JO069_13335 [Verrucomicrobia bacterium]|nr:hypothetical protein [Verrucomicrobiota bacterium]